MIKDKLNKLYKKNIDKTINKSIIYMNENYDENSLRFILKNAGFSINDSIILRYYDCVGFKCQDINEKLYGKSPLCQNVERFLNRD
jgi:hypothetical protein